jgi:hypothetical protein
LLFQLRQPFFTGLPFFQVEKNGTAQESDNLPERVAF